MSEDQVWSSGGDVGDTFYSLAGVKQCGGGHLVLHRASVREPYSEEKVGQLRPLLERQPYIRSVRYSDSPVGHNLDGWRKRYRNHLNLADMVSEFLGQPHYPRCEPWLFCDDPLHVSDVIVHRSHRYLGPMRWHRLIEEYIGRATFIGAPDEYERWCNEFGWLPYHYTEDWWEVARVIAGAMMFIGNQSAPMALALGLCTTYVWQERCPAVPNCHFERHGCYYGDCEPPSHKILPASGRTLLTEDRLHNIFKFIRETGPVGGRAANCGAYRGGSSAMVAFHCPDREVDVFDSLGLPESEEDCLHKKGEFAGDEADLWRFLSRYPNCRLHIGRFPETAIDAKYAFVHLDFDLYSSTKAALDWFAPRMSRGGAILIDDVHWKNCSGVDRAIRDCGLMDRLTVTAPQQGVIRF